MNELDFIFPFFVLAYGALMSLVLNTPFLMELAEKHFPQPLQVQMKSHRVLALICLVVGTVWSLQNIWLNSASF